MIEETRTLDGTLVAAGENVINHPSHYNAGNIEAIDVIEDWKLNFSLGSAVKYICRAGHKDGNTKSQDLQKAAWYINREIERESKKSETKSD